MPDDDREYINQLLREQATMADELAFWAYQAKYYYAACQGIDLDKKLEEDRGGLREGACGRERRTRRPCRAGTRYRLMSVASALITLRRELVAIGVPATRVEIWMAQPDMDLVLKELRGPAYRAGNCVRSIQQAAGFHLVGEPEVKDHAHLLGDLIDA